MEFNIANNTKVDSKEIVEIGVVIIDSARNEICSFSSKIRPTSGRLSDNTCKFLSVSRAEIVSSPSIQEVFKNMEQAIAPYLPRLKYWCSWGDLDYVVVNHFRRKLGLQTKLFSVVDYVDAQETMAMNVPSVRNKLGLMDAVEDYGDGWAGSHHNALDDARNMASLVGFWRV